MSVLRQAGADEHTARSAYGALHTYTIGFAAVEASRVRRNPHREQASDLSRQLATYTGSEQFTAGLRYVLAGIAQRIGTAA